MNTIMNTLEKLGFVRNEEMKEKLQAMSTAQLMKDFILPRCLCLPRSGERYPRISDDYMLLMAEHGNDFLRADYELGSVLLECAMQRISRHPSLPAIDYRGNLPEAYKQYSACSVNPDGINGCPDEPGLWGDAEVHFLLKMLPTCLELSNQVYADHAKLILFQMVSLLNKQSGGSLYFLWLEISNRTQEEVWLDAVNMLYAANLTGEFIDYCVEQNWRLGKNFFSLPLFDSLNEEYLLSKIDLDKETYVSGVRRKFLKLFWLYDKFTRKKISEEIHQK